MTKPTIAFIDHPFHRKTRSSNFFVDLLAKDFDVHVFFLEPDPRTLMREIAESDYQLVICWQTEFCAPYLLLRGKRVICIPMYDGVANAPDWYWLPMRQARFINFCERLHLRHRSLGIESFYLKYFGELKDDIPQADFDELHGFFWQRRPEEGLNYKFARNLIGDVVSTLHIHNAPDMQRAEDWRPDSTCSVSHFSANGNSYREALERANVFVCPRKAEGIGLTMIEAMARGMCIIAHDEPTANEYIVDGINGFLVDYGKGEKFYLSKKKGNKKHVLNIDIARENGRRARELYIRGCHEWQEDSKLVPFYIRTTPQPDLTAREKNLSEAYLDICRYARGDYYHYLHLLLKLYNRGLRGEEAAAIRIRERVKWSVKRVPGATILWQTARRLRRLGR